MGVMILNQISKGLFRKEGEEWSLSGTVNSCLASTVSTKMVVLRKGNTVECNYTHSCFYQTVHSLVEMVIGDARKLDKCLCQFLLSPCASFKWFFTNEFKKHWGVYLDWLQYTKHLIGSAQNQPSCKELWIVNNDRIWAVQFQTVDQHDRENAETPVCPECKTRPAGNSWFYRESSDSGEHDKGTNKSLGHGEQCARRAEEDWQHPLLGLPWATQALWVHSR